MADKYIVIQNDYMDGIGIDEDTFSHERLSQVLNKVSLVVFEKEEANFTTGESVAAEALDEDNYLFGFSMSNKKTSEETTFEVGTVS